MRVLAMLFGVVVFAGATDSRVQDLVAVAPDAAKVEYQDARVRIVRLRIPANGSLPEHDRPSRVVISLTPNYVRLTRPNGTTSITRTQAGTAAWSEPATRSVVNLADTQLENIVIELNTASDPAKPVMQASPSPSGDYLTEPRHRWLFENQYVRVYDVRIPPGATTAFHRHAYDSVAVRVSGGLVAVQREGEPWGPPETVEPRSVTFDADSRKPFTHRVRNAGPAEYHVILVQLLPQWRMLTGRAGPVRPGGT